MHWNIHTVYKFRAESTESQSDLEIWLDGA